MVAPGGAPKGSGPARDPPVTRRGTKGEPREGEAWGSCDKSRKQGVYLRGTRWEMIHQRAGLGRQVG